MAVSPEFLRQRIQHKIEDYDPGSAASPAVLTGGDVAELLAVKREDEFLREACRRAFRREADSATVARYQRLLAGGSRLEVLNRMRADALSGCGPVAGPARIQSGARPGWRDRCVNFFLVRAVRLVQHLPDIRRLDLLLNKSDHLSRELSQQSDRVTAKVDESTATTCTKIDRFEISAREYFATAEQIRQLEDRIARLEDRERRSVIPAGTGVVAVTVDGMVLGIPAEEWRLSAHYAMRGPLEPGVTQLFRRLVRPEGVVVDVGANLGYYTVLAGRLAGPQGRIYSFEPTPATFRLLGDNILANDLAGRVTRFRKAVMDREGVVTFHVHPGNSGHNTAFAASQEAETIEVECTTLDAVLPPGGTVDLVKIDAEGAEPYVLRGMPRTIADNPKLRIVLEFAPEHLARSGVPAPRFFDEILDLGFEVKLVDDLTGELRPADRNTIIGRESSMLLLSLRPEPAGGAS